MHSALLIDCIMGVFFIIVILKVIIVLILFVKISGLLMFIHGIHRLIHL